MKLLRLRIKLHVLWLAVKGYGSPAKAFKALKHFYDFRTKIFGRRSGRKAIRHEGKYYFALYAPGYPSKRFDDFVRQEMNRFLPMDGAVPKLSHIHLAITTKCPMHCEHCFEWENLHKPEPFSVREFSEVIRRYQKAGVCSIHLSGGEPMVRVADLEQIIREAGGQSDCWIISSGFNMTPANAQRMKEAGAIGVIISLDHVEPEKHDQFRGYTGAFQLATDALRNAKAAKLLTAVSICATRAFLRNPENLERYARMARDLGVTFIQLLEPKPIGHYTGRDVLLRKPETDQLEDFMYRLNYERAYADYPIVIYHGHYQRKAGCAQAGGRSLYIDAAGNIHSCPFCHSADYKLRDLLDSGAEMPAQVSSCPVYQSIG
jgi:MoaA/NifB/PqqE/SkfB family radical SAM enzyme